MLTFTFRQRRTTAVTFLVIFLNVLFGQVVCAARANQPHRHSVPAAAHHHPHGTAAHSHPVKPHRHDPATASASPAAHQHDAGHAHPHKAAKSAAECCQDDAAAIWAALHTPPKVTFAKAEAPLVLDLPPAPFNWQPGRFRGNWAVWQAVRLVLPQHLPPKIPDLRVFLHSLTV